MNSVGSECTELKKAYDACFNVWFSDHFLRGRKEDRCAPLLKVYQDCVKNAIRTQNIELWEVEQDILGTDKEKTVPPKK
uniref:Putative tp53-regulated inhibitor of apoptosis n=1 Tax=Ornithodoros turicata TaxID=34597 RepID=A0A2R5LGE6_9ACAR